MSWYIVIERMTMELDEMEPIVIGPFEDEDRATEHMNNSMDVEDWLTDEAKQKNYIVDDVYMTKTPTKPSYGFNPPVFDDDEIQWIPLGGRKTDA